MLVVNTGSAALDLPHEDGGSLPSSRFRNVGDATITVDPDGAAWVLRDRIFGRWLTCVVGVGSFALTHLGQPLTHLGAPLTHTI